jgi:hypothetical protein
MPAEEGVGVVGVLGGNENMVPNGPVDNGVDVGC